MKIISLLFVLLSLCQVSFAQSKSSPKLKSTVAPKTTTTYSSPVQESYFAGFEYELQTSLSSAAFQTYKRGSDSYTSLEAQASLSKVIKNNIQAGGEAHISNTSGGGSSSYFEFMGFGVYNFDHDLKQSLYAKGGVGIQNVINDKGSNEAKFAFMVGGGKRILVLDRFTYNPEARIVMVDGTTRIQILLLNFSLLY